MKQLFTFLFLIFSTGYSYCQNDTNWQAPPRIKISGFADIYYVKDFGSKTHTAKRQDFLYNHNRKNEVNLNLGLIKVSVNQAKYHARVALQTGTYAIDNYAAEEGVMQNIMQANVGISLNKKNSLWLDAGIMPSHIGFESAVSINNPTLTRSLMAENSPYFETGAKLSWQANEHWKMAAFWLNGWQRIARQAGNSTPALGTQISYQQHSFKLNWSTFSGSEFPDSTKRMRYFSNLYAQWKKGLFTIYAGFDLGFEQQHTGSSTYNTWLAPAVIIQTKLSDQWQTALRYEYYQDKHGVIIPVNAMQGFAVNGLSANIDFMPNRQIACRLEGRWMGSQNNTFPIAAPAVKSNFVVAASIAIKFGALVGGQ
ncbi:outer membrane beta-barrel protein [bacterium]|nr:outer membrane beta-barrel protein [bacterium]